MGVAVPTNTVAVVTVTYGRRLVHLQKVVNEVIRSDEVTDVVIVDNGSETPILETDFNSHDKISIIRFEGNTGSAAGFSAGIDYVLNNSTAKYLSLLDDDNVPDEGYYRKLIHLNDSFSGKPVAFSAVRMDQGHYKSLLNDPAKPELIEGSFLGFDVESLLKRLAKRVFLRTRSLAPTALRRVLKGPYGGLFLPMSVAKAIGLPRGDFVLYADDHEYTARLLDYGVSLYLTGDAIVRDVDQSWTAKKGGKSRWIDTDVPQWRIYYAARNQHFLELQDNKNRARLRFNRFALTLRLYSEALLRHRSINGANMATQTFRIAIKDASLGRLGAHPSFVIPKFKQLS